MDILVVCHYGLYQDLNASFVHNQVREYVRLGHRVRVIIPIGVGKQDGAGRRLAPLLDRCEADGVELYYLRYVTLSHWGERGLNTASACSAVKAGWKRLFSDFQPRVIHAHTLGFDSQIGAWLKKRLHCPLVVTTHGSDAAIPLEQGRTDAVRSWCDQADTVVCVSGALANKLRACGTETPIQVVLNGYQPRHLASGGEREHLSWIQVGHLQHQKRFSVTIRAFADFYSRHPGARLTIIGQGPERPALEELCRQLGVADGVRFLGQIPNEDVLAEMAKARFYVMPSVREGFGIVYLEAMASGCITIGTQGEGIADLIESGVNGFLVPPDDPETIVRVIERCLADPALRETVACRGRDDARSLTWVHNARQYVALFESLVSEVN